MKKRMNYSFKRKVITIICMNLKNRIKVMSKRWKISLKNGDMNQVRRVKMCFNHKNQEVIGMIDFPK